MFELKIWEEYTSQIEFEGTYANPELAYEALLAWCEPQSSSDSDWVAIPDSHNDYLNRYFDIHWTYDGTVAVKKTFNAHILKWDND